MKVTTETVISTSKTRDEIKGKVEKKSGKRIGYNYIIIKSLKESQKNDVVKCLYIRSFTNFGFCVIKEGTLGDSTDKHGRDIIDRLKWQQHLHSELQNKVKVPRLLGSFEENGNFYLVLEQIKGKSLYKACKENYGGIREHLMTGTKSGFKFINYLLQIVDLLDRLHQHNIVHRDATATNFIIMPSGKVAVIDMELSYSLDQQTPNPPFQLGTHGYMSPEQLAIQTPTIKEDVFSAGAILLLVWTNISPFKLTDFPLEELSNKVHFLVPDKEIADVIVKCLHPDSTQRPTLPTVQNILTQYRKDLQLKKQRPASKTIPFSKKQIKHVIQQSINTLSSPLFADEQKGWFSEDMSSEPDRDKTKIKKSWYTSFNRGATGVLYLLNLAHRHGFDIEPARQHITKALRLVELKYINRIDIVSPSLHFGASGIAVCIALAIRDGLIQPHSPYSSWINTLLAKENRSLGFTNGVAGQGMAHFLCADFLEPDIMKQRLDTYVDYLLQTQEKDGSWIYKEVQNKQKKRQGFATGVAGILYFLLDYAQRYKNDKVFASVEYGLSWLMKKAIHREGKLQWRNDKKKELIYWWGEGASGIALAFIKAFSCLNDPRYKQYATGALLNTPAFVLNNNLGQNDGISGLGEIYLEAYRIFKEPVWMERADWVAQVIMHLKKDHSQFGSFWYVQHEREPTADFMTGNSGVIHFLLRYCFNDTVNFPLL